MKTILFPTDQSIKRERTNVTANTAPGNGVVLPVANSSGYAVNDFIVIGPEGSEQAELCKVTAVTTQTLTLATMKLVHYTDEPIVKYQYNQRKFYGSLTASGSYVELTSYGSPADILPGDPQGNYLEYDGTEGYAYFKSTYYNTVTTDETDLADAEAVAGDDSTRYCSIYAIRKQTGLTNNPFITDAQIEVYRKRAENEIDSYLNAKYVLPLINSSGTQEIPFMVENLATLLAGGYMDYQEFGADGQGVKWLGEARAILKQLQSPGGQQLLGSDRLEMQTRTNSNGIMSYPDQVDNVNGPDRKFTMRQRF